jgi:dihydropteroate synthase
MDSDMFNTIANLNVPYIIMHMQGTPQNMQKNPTYNDLMSDIFLFFAKKIDKLNKLGVSDIIIDPGFGFGKTQEHNFEILRRLDEFKIFELPILVGVSRKSMIYNTLECSPGNALNGTTVINTLALDKGADILRVHDVKEAVETKLLLSKCKK